jgi:hypothetical protein
MIATGYVLQKADAPDLYWAHSRGWQPRLYATISPEPRSPEYCAQRGGVMVSAAETDPRAGESLWPHFLSYAERAELDPLTTKSYPVWEAFVAGAHKGAELAAHQQLGAPHATR